MPLPSQRPGSSGQQPHTPAGQNQQPPQAYPPLASDDAADPGAGQFYESPAPAPADEGFPAAGGGHSLYSNAPAEDGTFGNAFAGEHYPVEEQASAGLAPQTFGPSDLDPESVAAAQALLDVIADDQSSEVICNGPAEILVKIEGARYHVAEIQFPDEATYHRVLNEYLLPWVDTDERIDGHNPLVEGQMEMPSNQDGVPPLLARVHILCPPLVKYAKVTIAKKARYAYTLDGLAQTGAMTTQMSQFLQACAHGRLSLVVSGPTGAGKTTLLQAVTHHFDQNDRIIVIEDTPELRLPLADVVYLCSTNPRPGLSADKVISTEFLVKASNRMRMDRVIVGELRGAEAAEWLIAANSGAEGSATTVHADSPRRALDKLLGLATKSPTAASEQTLRREIAATVDVIVQASLIDGKHVVTAIEEISNMVRQESGAIATQPIYEYNRATGRHEVKNRPSEELVSTLAQRGITLDPSWFPRSM